MISHLDHLVLTVRDIPRSVNFYTKALGFEEVRFGEGRVALAFGNQKINLHQQGREIDPKAAAPTPGSADLCFIANQPIETVLAHVEACGLVVLEGPVPRTGARGPMISLYFRDPDGNLLEVSTYPAPPAKGRAS